MNVKQSELGALGYTFYEEWHVENVLDFVRREFQNPTILLQLFLGFQLITLLVPAYFFVAYFLAGEVNSWLMEMVLPFVLGLLSLFPITIIHELIHGFFYRICGAKKVKYGANFRKLIFHASAPGAVLKDRQLSIVALAPFVIINLCIILVMLFTTSFWWWWASGLLFMHTQGCVGDFSMVNFFIRKGNQKEWIMCDDEVEPYFTLYYKKSGSI